MFLAHGPISYILNESIQKKKIKSLSNSQQVLVMILSILFGIFPDVDLAILSMLNIPPFQHHLFFTHSAIYFITLWLILILVLKVIQRLMNRDSRKVLSNTLLSVIHWSFLIGTLSHLLADILFSYSRTLFPLQSQITILGRVIETNYFINYLLSPTFAAEILFICIFILFIFKKYFIQIKPIKYLIYFSILASSILLLFSTYMNQKTYNMAYNFENGRKAEDLDYDGVLDKYDLDIDNDGIHNIYEVDTKQLATFVESISTDKYIVTNSNDTVGKIKYSFGAFNSYRVISQAYFEQNLAIEPVLTQYAKSKYEINGYSIDISYPTLLYEYLIDNGTLNDLNSNEDTGKIFFVTEKNTVLNMGIVLENNLFSTVLPNDMRLVIHTQEDILDEYPNSDIKVATLVELK